MVPATRMWRLPSRSTWRGVKAGHIRATPARAARTAGVWSAEGSIRSCVMGWPGRVGGRSSRPSPGRTAGIRVPGTRGPAVSAGRSPSAVRAAWPRASPGRPSAARGAAGRDGGGTCFGPGRPTAAVGGRSALRVVVGVGEVAEEYMG